LNSRLVFVNYFLRPKNMKNKRMRAPVNRHVGSTYA
jgi:hypothetical protein